MRNAIRKCFGHILEDHRTKGHATLINAAIDEISQMEQQIAKDSGEIAEAHNVLSEVGVPNGDLPSRITHLISSMRELEETVKRISELT